MANQSSFYIPAIIKFFVALLFFTANLPILKVGPLSLSFFFGLILVALICVKYPQYLKSCRHIRLLLFFVAFSILSLFFSPLSLDGQSLFTLLQICYWYILATIFSNVFHVIETKIVIYAMLMALILTGIVFFIIPGEDGPLSQNESSFIAICLWPFALLLYTKGVKRILYVMSALVLLFLIGSRTGLIVVLLQIGGLYVIRKVSLKTITKFAVFIALIIVGISNVSVRTSIAETLFPEEADMQLLIENPNVSFQMDKSWVQRRIQQEKCKQVFAQNPILGIGPLNVEKYRFNINISKLGDLDSSILGLELRNSDFRSAHNSYYQLLAENGIAGVVLLSLLLFSVIKRMYNNKGIIGSEIALISLLGALVNLFMVSALWGTNTWLLLGIFMGYSKNSNKNNNNVIKCYDTNR